MRDDGLHPWERPAPEASPARASAFGLLPEELEALGAPGRARHTFAMLHRPWTWRGAEPFLARETRAWLGSHLDLTLPRVVDLRRSADGSAKLALELRDGSVIEALHMPREVREPRVTLCISSQVGCAMGCTFCATGAMGLRRNLTAGEIVAQVGVLLRELGPKLPHAVTLVFMGMGEPLHNLDQVHRAIRLLAHPDGLNISPRRITVSTSGLAPGIERLSGMNPRPWLALSLNATTDAARSALMPVNRAYDLARLRQALSNWALAPKEKLTLEYVLMAGVNDTPEDARRLGDWMGELRTSHNVNLIQYNGHAASPARETGTERLAAFVAALKEAGCFVTVRKSRGRDVAGACGQLATLKVDPAAE
jgi:23S rRNA (adenine2503-C2)-methyltransferase